MSINRITRERLSKDEALFNQLLPFAQYDENHEVFVHSDASLWAMFELQPRILTATSDADAFEMCKNLQEMLDSLESNIAVQFSWVTTFDVEQIVKGSLEKFPVSGPGGWMARRWLRMIRAASRSDINERRPRKMRLIVGFRFDPPWAKRGFLAEMQRTFTALFKGDVGVSAIERRKEYNSYVTKFRGEIDGKVGRLNDLGFRPRRLNGQDMIDILYPLLNRRNTKGGKFKRGRSSRIPVPTFDPHELLSNQISETPAEHPEAGILVKNGRAYRTISLVKAPTRLLPLMLSPLQGLPYESILSVTYSKDPREKQMKRLDALDSSLGFREMSPLGRSNQKIQHQIRSVRAAREQMYSNQCQLVRAGVHQTFICQTVDEAKRAGYEALATFPQLHGARGMVHEISDLGVMINSLPGCYDPMTDGPGWTNTFRSSRAARFLPLWGNWKGTNNPLIVLPSLWNRELVGFDLYDSNVAPNVLIAGVSGAGKSYLLCYILITMNRGHFGALTDGSMVERPPITFIFDKGMIGQPCGFDKVARLFNGRIYEATPARAPAMNFLARLGQTGQDHLDFKDLTDMCADVILDMATEGDRTPDRLERQAVIESLVEAHRIYRGGPKRREFILSDVVAVLRAPKRVEENAQSAERRQRISGLIADYYGDGSYARFFDRPGSLTLEERFIVFDLKGLSRNPDLQRVFLKIAMLWADTVMNDPKELDTRKILVFDEAHDLIGKTAAGVIETAFRLYRKRKGIVIAASQSGEDFYVGSGGQAIVQNSAHKIFLRQDPSKFHYTAQAFNLTPQQADVILRLRTVKGVESQFYLLSDIGEAALVLPLEPAFYWASTNNGDDNQLFQTLLDETNGNFWQALEKAATIAPNGAGAFARRRAAAVQAATQGDALDGVEEANADS